MWRLVVTVVLVLSSQGASGCGRQKHTSPGSSEAVEDLDEGTRSEVLKVNISNPGRCVRSYIMASFRNTKNMDKGDVVVSVPCDDFWEEDEIPTIEAQVFFGTYRDMTGFQFMFDSILTGTVSKEEWRGLQPQKVSLVVEGDVSTTYDCLNNAEGLECVQENVPSLPSPSKTPEWVWVLGASIPSLLLGVALGGWCARNGGRLSARLKAPTSPHPPQQGPLRAPPQHHSKSPEEPQQMVMTRNSLYGAFVPRQ